MSWTEPPEPSHCVPDVPAGHVITREHPAWHRGQHEAVWGTLAKLGRHNPFLGDFWSSEQYWADVYAHECWGKVRERIPQTWSAAQEAVRRVLPGMRLAVALTRDALGAALDSPGLYSAFHTGYTTSGNEDFDAYLQDRRDAEFHHFRYPAGHADQARPVYGYLTCQPFDDDSASGYGGQTLVLSRAALAHRTTWSSDDCLEFGYDVHPSPWTEPDLRSFVPAMADPERDDLGVAVVLTDCRRRPAYIEAQIHGGITWSQVHYAVLRTAPGEPTEEITALGARLSQRGIPWVHTVDFLQPDEYGSF